MKLIAGIDIGNSTTEVCLASFESLKPQFIGSSLVRTTGIKGTVSNVEGILQAIDLALIKAGKSRADLAELRVNEATPVIGDVAMETITETIITESTLIGHNPATPGGVGLGCGQTIWVDELLNQQVGVKVIPIIPKGFDFEVVAQMMNEALARGVDVQGAICQQDDAVLIANRLTKTLPIVDEVLYIEKVPLHMEAALEVSVPGAAIQILSNPYGIATVFSLTAEETKMIVPIARTLIGTRSAVVVRTPQGDVQARTIPAGVLVIQGARGKVEVDVDSGAQKIMESVEQVQPIEDILGEPGTNVFGMLERVRQVMGDLTQQDPKNLAIQDILAVDSFLPQKVQGGLAGELMMENVVALAAMVKTNRLPMQQIADQLEKHLQIPVLIAGVEANMAIQGALTTPGTATPIAVLDMGGGSTDGSIMTAKGEITAVHLGGAGDMVTMLIRSELGLPDGELAEDIKRYSLAKVESLYHIRLEDGTVQFFKDHLPPHLFARVVILKPDQMVPIPFDTSIERIRQVRREAKRKVFVRNAIRALARVAPTGNIRHIEFVVLVGGSALDQEISDMVTASLAEFGIVCGRGNIRGIEGPRNAVATGLALSHQETRT